MSSPKNRTLIVENWPTAGIDESGREYFAIKIETGPLSDGYFYVTGRLRREDAEHLQRAWNSHGAMLAALKQIHFYETVRDPNRGELFIGALRSVEAAIAKAEGRT